MLCDVVCCDVVWCFIVLSIDRDNAGHKSHGAEICCLYIGARGVSHLALADRYQS